MAQGKNTPTHIDLARGDAAFVVREGGGYELFLPEKAGDSPVPPAHLMLIGLAFGFEDKRLRAVLAKIIEERRRDQNPRSDAAGDVDPGAGH